MRFYQMRAGDPSIALRAFKLVAMADGVFADNERALLATAARCFGIEVDVDALEPITPEAIAAALPDEGDRKMVLQGAILMAIADAEVSREEARLLKELKSALGIDDVTMRVLERLAAGHRKLAAVEMMRRAPVLRDIWEKHGLAAFMKIVIQLVGLQRTDEALAEKYRRFEQLPEGTLGKEFFKHCRALGFGFPGEKGGLQEFTVQHDFCHVLTGYSTEPEGEMQIAAFTAGMRKSDPFFFLFFPVMMFNVGVGPTNVPGVHTTVGLFDPDKLFRAMERGHQVSRDLLGDWDYWPDVVLPVEEVRRKYNVTG